MWGQGLGSGLGAALPNVAISLTNRESDDLAGQLLQFLERHARRDLHLEGQGQGQGLGQG